MRDETIVADDDQIADERVGLNPAPLADAGAFLYFDEWSDECFVADFAPIQVYWFYDAHTGAKLHVNDSDGTAINFIHAAQY